MLEVVSTSKEDELSSLRAAAAAGVDWVLGGTHAADGAGILPDGVRYCPFPGRVVDHPSVLLGTIDEIAADAERLTALDHVTGLDLLAYRHPTADHDALIREVVRRSSGPVIVAGSIASIDRALAVSEAARGDTPSAARSSTVCCPARRPSQTRSVASSRRRRRMHPAKPGRRRRQSVRPNFARRPVA